MARTRIAPAKEDPSEEVTLRATGDQTGFSVDGDEYSVEADGTMAVERRHVAEALNHGFEIAPVAVAAADKKAKK